jgi:small subunit ribosomal protein S27Ae
MSAKKPKIKGKKKHQNKPTSQRWKKYRIEGNRLIREKCCPRCGPGIFLMKDKNRVYCGKCHFTEFFSASKMKAKAQN